jgi:hypothetical protein
LIPADPLIPERDALKRLRKRWVEVNRDLVDPPENAKFSLARDEPGGELRFRVRAHVTRPFSFRPWLPGVLEAEERLLDSSGRWQVRKLRHESDLTVVDRFSDGSPLLSEAHTQGAPLMHGLSIQLKPYMDSSEERGTDPETGLKGPAFYRALEWNRDTGWGDLTLLR